MTPPGTGLPTDWARLHKLSPLLRSARAVVALGTVVGTRQLGPGQHSDAWFDLAAVGAAAVAGTISWLVTRWRIHNGELQIETGWIRRQSLRVPLTRLQAVDVVRPLLARMLGLAEVRIVVAGHGSGRTRLAYLTEERATDVRARLLALAHGLEGDTPEPAERPILTVPAGRIVAANLLAPGPLLVLALLFASIAVFTANTVAGASLVGTAVALGAAVVLTVVRQIGSEWEFAVGEAPDGLRLKAGLLETRAETIPYGRVQAVRWVEPLAWRPWGWVRLEIDVARRRDRDRAERESGASTRALLPVGSAEDARRLLARALPGATVTPPAGAQAPRRARWRAPLMRHYLHAWHDDTYVMCATGRVRRSVVVVPMAKVQSLRWSQGPLSRALHLATVHADTAGRRFPGWAPARDETEAARWIQSWPDLAREARHRGVSRS